MLPDPWRKGELCFFLHTAKASCMANVILSVFQAFKQQEQKKPQEKRSAAVKGAELERGSSV